MIVFKAVTSIALPLFVFLCGAGIMGKMTDRQYVMDRLSKTAAPKDRKLLSARVRYDLPAVNRYLAALDRIALDSEQHFLELDLVFPFLYGAALASGLLIAWTALGRPFPPFYLIAPVSVTLFADWTENLIQLNQFRRYALGGADALNGQWIRIASAATQLKLLFFVGSSIFLIGLVVTMTSRASRSG